MESKSSTLPRKEIGSKRVVIRVLWVLIKCDWSACATFNADRPPTRAAIRLEDCTILRFAGKFVKFRRKAEHASGKDGAPPFRYVPGGD